MKTVMHSLNDLRVLLSDPFTQAFVLEALKEDQLKFINQGLTKSHAQAERDKHRKTIIDKDDGRGASRLPE